MKGLKLPVDLSQATSRASEWFARNAHRYRYEDRALFRELLGLIEKPLHLLALDEELRRRTFPVERFKDSVAGGATQPT